MLAKKVKRRRKIRYGIRKKIVGTQSMPRLAVFRSNKDIYVQVIDDSIGHTIVSASSREKDIASKKVSKIEKSKEVGLSLSKKALKIGIKKVVFDRGGFLFHGRVKAVADGAKEGGLII